MKQREKGFLSIGKALSVGACFLFLYILYSALSTAHVPVFKPPPYPPGLAKDGYAPRGGITQPGGATTRGPAGANTPLTAGPSTPRGVLRGGQTRKIRKNVTPQLTWEHWWARNRYRFLNFPNIHDTLWRFPVTPNAQGMKRDPKWIESLRSWQINYCRPLLSHDSSRLKRAALTGLAMLNDGESCKSMVRLLKDGNQTVRDAAVTALGMLRRPEARHLLLHMARGTKTACMALDQSAVPDYLRAYAEIFLALSDAKGVNAVLLTMAADPTTPPEVKAMALEGIGLIGKEEGIKFLIEFVEGSSKARPELLATAVAALAKSGEPVVVPFMEKSLSSTTLAVQQSAALGMGSVAPKRDDYLVKRLFRRFKGTNDQALKGFCLISMGRIGGGAAIQMLEEEVSSGPPSICGWACIGLGFALEQAPDPPSVKHLIHHLNNHSNRSVRGAAAIALGLAKCKAAVPDLIKKMKEGDDPFFRGYCAMALGMIQDPAALEPLRRAFLEDDLPQVRSQAVLALALQNDFQSTGDLVDMLINSDNDAIKAFVSMSLGFMGDVRVVEAIQREINKSALDDLTLLHCIRLSCKLLSGRVTPYLDRVAAGSNFAAEFPMVGTLLEMGI
jgi:HEAT repeat protein